MKLAKEISDNLKMPKQPKKNVLMKGDISFKNILSKKINPTFQFQTRNVLDHLKQKKWNDLEKTLRTFSKNKINLFGILIRDFDCNKNSDLKLFSRLKLYFPELKIIYAVEEKKAQTEKVQSLIDLGFDALYFDEKILSKKMTVFLQKINFRNNDVVAIKDEKIFSEARKNIDKIDDELLVLLSKRNKVIKTIGKIKRENDFKIFQIKRWEAILKESFKHAEKYDIDKDLLRKILEEIHFNAIKAQLKIYLKRYQ